MKRINQAVILCAGKGGRMGEKFKDTQKCTLTINKQPLILQSVANLVKVGIREVILLTGHKPKQVKACFKETLYSQYVRYVFCGDPYKKTLNTISTLAHAKDFIKGPFLCVHEDVLFHPTMITGLLSTLAKHQCCLVISVSKRINIAPTHARVKYNNNFVVESVERPDTSNADVWIGVDACQPDLLDKLCGNSQGELARTLLLDGKIIRVVPYLHPWVHIVTARDLSRDYSWLSFNLIDKRPL